MTKTNIELFHSALSLKIADKMTIGLVLEIPCTAMLCVSIPAPQAQSKKRRRGESSGHRMASRCALDHQQYGKALSCDSPWWSLLGVETLTWTSLSVVSKFSLPCYSAAPAELIKGGQESQTFYLVSGEYRPYSATRHEKAARQIQQWFYRQNLG